MMRVGRCLSVIRSAPHRGRRLLRGACRPPATGEPAHRRGLWRYG